MKHVTIVIPKGNANLSSIAGSFEILNFANEYWRKMGNKPMIEIHIAGFVTDLKVDVPYRLAGRKDLFHTLECGNRFQAAVSRK